VPGPARVIDGVGVGFAHTPAGADAAGAHDLLEIERAMDTLNARRTAAVASLVATGDQARAISAHASAVIAIERSSGVPLRRVAICTDRSPTRRPWCRYGVESWIYATAAREALWAIERVSLVLAARRLARQRRSPAPHRQLTSPSATCGHNFSSRGPAMRRSASTLAVSGWRQP